MLYLLKKFGKWYKSSKKIINYRIDNFNSYSEKMILKRLQNEIRGYFIPLKIIHNKESKEYKSIVNVIFNKNIISWIYYCMIKIDKSKTLSTLKKNFKYFNLRLKIRLLFICFVLILFPKKILVALKKIGKLFLN
jgi:hypothetical protein